MRKKEKKYGGNGKPESIRRERCREEQADATQTEGRKDDQAYSANTGQQRGTKGGEAAKTLHIGHTFRVRSILHRTSTMIPGNHPRGSYELPATFLGGKRAKSHYKR